MTANELRIGNLVKYSDGGGHTELSALAIHYFERGNIEVEPMPLTEEWLIRLGFTRDDETDYRWYLLDKSIAYDADDNCIRIVDSWAFGKRYFVHEIQNLIFALTGEELTIKE